MYKTASETAYYSRDELYYDFPTNFLYMPVFLYVKSPEWDALLSHLQMFFKDCRLTHLNMESSVHLYPAIQLHRVHIKGISDEKEEDWWGVFVYTGLPYWVIESITQWVEDLACFDTVPNRGYFNVPPEHFRDYIKSINSAKLRYIGDRFLFVIAAEAFDKALKEFEDLPKAHGWKIDRSIVVPMVWRPIRITSSPHDPDGKFVVSSCAGLGAFLPALADIEFKDMEQRMLNNEVAIVTRTDFPAEFNHID